MSEESESMKVARHGRSLKKRRELKKKEKHGVESTQDASQRKNKKTKKKKP